MSFILIGGGSRSGKSTFALEYAKRHRAPLAFLATAEPLDEEMRRRVSAHQAERGTEFHTMEEPLHVAEAIEKAGNQYGAIVLDCLTLWLSNLMLGGAPDVPGKVARLLRVASDSPSVVVLVTNEVGCGIVPENALAREFRDLAGSMNQKAAAAAAEAYWMAFGIPMRLK